MGKLEKIFLILTVKKINKKQIAKQHIKCDVISILTDLYVFRSRKMFRKRALTCLKCGGFNC